MSNCIFCNLLEKDIVQEYEHFYLIRDVYPVTSLHTLIVTKKHIVSYFQCSKDVTDEIPKILNIQKSELKMIDNTITGFNIGMNIGEDAGQSIFHCHIHIIPRRNGDVTNPKGGIRGVIPEKQKY